jgi:hypothetical protein
MLLGGVAASDAQRSSYVVGRVVDDSTGAGVEYAELTLAAQGRGGTVVRALSDADGRFVLTVPAGSVPVIRVRRLGYEPLLAGLEDSVARGERALVIRLIPRAAPLVGVTATAEARSRSMLLSGFEGRRRLGTGTFFTREQLEERGWPTIPNLLRTVAGVNVTESGRRSGVSMARSAQARRCHPVLFLDGVRLNSSSDPAESVRRVYEMIPGTDLTAVEIYKGRSELPAEFGGPEVGCGAIVAWSKSPADEIQRDRPR